MTMRKRSPDIDNNIPDKTIQLLTRLLNMVAPPPDMAVSEWAETYRYIPDEYGAHPGKWNSDAVPYQKEPMRAFTQKGIHKVVMMCAAQLGKSEIMFNVIGRFIHLDPCPMLLVQPTLGDAQDWSKERLSPTISKTPVLARLVHEQKSRNSDNTILKKLFPGGYLALVGSNAPSGLAKRSIRVLLFDEVDRFEKSAGSEGDPVDLGIKRTSNFWNHIIGLFSTPTDVTSRIYREYQLGTQEEWMYQCPNCGEWHWISLDHMEWEADTFDVNGAISYQVKDVVWRCPDCGFAFSEQEMRNAPQQYIAKNPHVQETRSFHVNAFASPWLTWKQIIAEYLTAKEDEETLKTFVNTRLADIYNPASNVKDVDALLARREPYDAEVPEGVLLLTAAVDTQDNRLEYEVAGWGKGEERWGIQKGTILGVPDQDSTWDQLDEILDHVYFFKNGIGQKISRTFIDHGGHYSDAVYKYCQANAIKGRFAIQGSHSWGVPVVERLVKAKGYPDLTVILLGVNDGKQYIYQRLIDITEPGPKYMHFPDREGCGYDRVYYKGLLSERLVTKMEKGKLVQKWVNIAADHRNEPLDLQVYNFACMRSTTREWDKWEHDLKESVYVAEKPSPPTYGCFKKGVSV
ncbi:terminase [Megasphaera cerevisiae DSM 20462]|uniref:Terminase n=2 Tax=Megasphaera TaxID=906 RepID=A0A0J6WSC5_9FIRM|nr:terminase [Megasphaera cerevisiae DSM 20462]SJZ72033.1 Phage terminase, large subunit GpA [Megasphaera cerevisiae DSM 20462]